MTSSRYFRAMDVWFLFVLGTAAVVPRKIISMCKKKVCVLFYIFAFSFIMAQINEEGECEGD